MRYFIAYLSTALIFAVIGVFLTSFSIQPLSGREIATTAVAAFITLQKFLRDMDRLPDKAEYWTLVLLSTVISVVMALAQFAIYLFVVRPSGFEGGIWWWGIFILVIFTVFMNMFGYSRVLGGSALQRLRKRRDRT